MFSGLESVVGRIFFFVFRRIYIYWNSKEIQKGFFATCMNFSNELKY